MYRFPYSNPYAWQNPWGRADRKCYCCKHLCTGKEIYGSGRFCSSLCAQLRTPENHFKWLQEHPEELAAWVEKQKKS